MERSTAVDLIKNALAQLLGQGTGRLTEQTPLFDGLALDSMGVVELLIILENMADIDVQVDELDYRAFETIGTLADFLLRIEKSHDQSGELPLGNCLAGGMDSMDGIDGIDGIDGS